MKKAPPGTGNFMHIVDRRLNPSGKNLANRQRFMRRAKSLIRKAVHESSASRSIKDADQAGEVALPAQGVHEPSFHRSASGGLRDHLLPGNKQYIEGDTIPRPQGGAGGGGSEGSPDGEGQDDFRFALSRDEFVDLFLEDLELPGPGKAPRGRQRKRVLASRRLFGHRLAGQPRAAAHGAQQPVAADCAEAAEARRTAAPSRRDRRAQPGRRRSGASRRAGGRA